MGLRTKSLKAVTPQLMPGQVCFSLEGILGEGERAYRQGSVLQTINATLVLNPTKITDAIHTHTKETRT